jgi:hypothetical protein
MTNNPRLHVPRQGRPPDPLDELERAVARTADLVLKLSTLADRYDRYDRYDRGDGSAERVVRLRDAVRRGRDALLALAAEERQPV